MHICIIVPVLGICQEKLLPLSDFIHVRNAQIFSANLPFTKVNSHCKIPIMDIMIFDDHSMMRAGLRACFSDTSLYNIAGEAENLEKAKKVVSAYIPATDTPCIAIVDVGFTTNVDNIEKAQGFELVKFINQADKNIKCIMYSSYMGQAYIRTAMSIEIGAWAYVSKISESKVLMEAVNAVAGGQHYVDPYLSSILVTTNNVFDLLSKREREVLRLVQKDYTNPQIAAELNITERTVENHLSTIYSKTNTKNKTELVEMFGKL